MQEVIPGLYVGDMFSVQDLAKSNEKDVKRVVNCAKELNDEILQLEKDDYHHIPLLDDDTFEDHILFYQSIRPFLAFMDKSPLKEKPVLIHCQMGISRSCSMVVAYLMHIGMFSNVESAIAHVISKRECAFEGGEYIVYNNALNEYFS